MSFRVLVLHGDRVGDRNNLHGLAARLGWPYDLRRVLFRRQNHVQNMLWKLPEIIEADPVPVPAANVILVATWAAMRFAVDLKSRSSTPIVIVNVGRPYTRPSLVDIWVQSPQFIRLPFRTTLPMATAFHVKTPPASLNEFDHLPRPRIAVLIGGHSGAMRWNVREAAEVGRRINAEAQGRGAGLLITTSYRTGTLETDALLDQITVPHVAHRWGANGVNPYFEFLHAADSVWVTSDSSSMIAEAHDAGKKVEVLPLKPRGPINMVLRHYPSFSLFGREAYLSWLRQQGYFRWLGEPAIESRIVRRSQTDEVDTIRHKIIQAHATMSAR